MTATIRKNTIAAAVLAAMLLCVGLVYYSGERLGDGLQGPSKIARAPDGGIWVASHGKLHRFTAAGEREEVVALAELGRGPIVSEVLPLSDGSVVLAEAEPSAGYRCDLAARRCASLTAGIAAQVGPTRHALMIAADESTRRFYVSDNANHRLILLDFDGKVLDVTGPRRVVYPNELAVATTGELVVVDTNHHRLARISVAKDGFGADLWQMRTDAGALHRPGRTWPMDFAPAPKDGWWVLNARSGMKDADLLLFDAGGAERKRVDLGAASDPTQILAFGEGVLVAEPTQARLLEISADGAVAGPWGGREFNAELADLRASRLAWRAARLAAQALLVALPLAAIWLLWRLGERLPARGIAPAQGIAPVEVSGGVHWIEVSARYRRRNRIFSFAMLGAMVALGLGVALLVEVFVPEEAHHGLPVAISAGVIAAAVALHVFLAAAMRRVFRLRLGTDGRDFFFDPGNGKVEQYPFTALATGDGRQLLAGKRLIALDAPLGTLFDADEVRRYLFARMMPSSRVGVFALFRQALEQGNREIWLVVVICAVAAAAFLVPLLFPGIAAYLKLLAASLLAKTMQ